MANYGTKLRIEALRTLAFGSIGAAYANLGTPFANPANMVIIENNTDVAVMLSWDGGVVDHLPLPAYTCIVFDNTTNRAKDDGFYMTKGTQMAVKRRAGAPSLGSVDVTVIYSRP